MTGYKLVALDMDGTMLNNSKQLTEKNAEAIRTAVSCGVHIIIATGRAVQNVLPYLQQLGLQLPMITVNGCEVWRAPNDLLERASFKTEEIRKLHGLAQEYDVWFWAYGVKGLYNKDEWTEHPETETWLKFGYFIDDDDLRWKVRSVIESWDEFEVTNSHPRNIEINPMGISKESGLRTICKEVGVSIDETIAIGDSLNDLTMVTAAGFGVAMGNAQEKLKRVADYITSSNEENGVARIIMEYTDASHGMKH